MATATTHPAVLPAQGAWARPRSPAAFAGRLPASARQRTRLEIHRSAAAQQQASTVTDASVAGREQQGALPPLLPLDDGYEQTCTFSSYANWLLPGALLVGRYPYVESSRCTDPIQGEAQLRALLEAGVRVFVSLQQELPEQGAIKIGGVGGFLPYKATAQLIASAMSDPPSLEEVAALRTPELDRFLPPRRSGRPNLSSTRHRLELEFLHCPVPDLGLPQEAALEALIADDIAPRLRAAVAHGGEGAVYLHCWGGRGRVGTAAACLLAQLYGVSAEEALERVQRAFDTRRDEARRSPETTEQLEFVRKYIAARQ